MRALIVLFFMSSEFLRVFLKPFSLLLHICCYGFAPICLLQSAHPVSLTDVIGHEVRQITDPPILPVLLYMQLALVKSTKRRSFERLPEQ